MLGKGLVGLSWVGIGTEDCQFLFISRPLLSNFGTPFFLDPFLQFNVTFVM